MKSMSALANIHRIGEFGDYENKNKDKLLRISEISNLLIIQIVQYKNSKIELENIKIDDLNLKNIPLSTTCNQDTRILWNGPKNWLLVSSKKDLIKKISEVFNDTDFAVTDLSHSRAIMEIEGDEAKEVLKKGCPFNFNELNKNISLNSTFNGISITIDMLNNNPNKIRIFSLRSFGESLYHSITDASLEFGYKSN